MSSDYLIRADARRVSAADFLRDMREASRAAAIAKATPGGWYYFEGAWRRVAK